MLPILRILPVGGVLLAIFILVLALSPPDGPRAPLNTTMAPARGVLLAREHHPETRQFLIMAALKRADELNRLRDLPDTPTRTAPTPSEPAAIAPAPAAPAAEEPKIAGLPANRSEPDPEPDETAATGTPHVSIPVERGEITELPTATETTSTGEKPEQAKEQTKEQTNETKEQAKPQREIRRRVAHRLRRTRVATAPQRPISLFEALFGGQQYRYPQTPSTQQAAQGQYQGQYQQPAYAAQLQQQQATQPVGDPYLSRPKYY